jgi:pilus assembly protein FimV
VVDLALDAPAPMSQPAAEEAFPVEVDLAGASNAPATADVWPVEPEVPVAVVASASPVPDLSGDEELVADPLQRKLALADEFMQIGDTDAARDLLSEVLAQGSADLQGQARQRLDQLD